MHGPHVTNQSRAAAHGLAAVIYLMCAGVSAMLLYGVVKSRPSYLMPFFWIKLCDFFFSLPTFLSTLYGPQHPYGPHHPPSSLAAAANFDSGNHSNGSGLDMRKVFPSGSSMGTHSLLVATCVILFKGYFLCVVWKCYRYLKMREMLLPLHIVSGSGCSRTDCGIASSGRDVVIPPGVVLPSALNSISPPDYETATKANTGMAPPDYETAIRQQLQQENKIEEGRLEVSNSNAVEPPVSIPIPTSNLQTAVVVEPSSPAAASCSSYSGSSSSTVESVEDGRGSCESRNEVINSEQDSPKKDRNAYRDNETTLKAEG